MIASFLAIFVAFAVCQALLTVKFADFLSSERTSGRSTVAPTGDVASAKQRVLGEVPSYSIGIKDRPLRTPLEPSALTYDQRSLYWSGKRELGRSHTADGARRLPSSLSIHKSVQDNQPASPVRWSRGTL